MIETILVGMVATVILTGCVALAFLGLWPVSLFFLLLSALIVADT